mgnify:CR=1 FL=1
MNDCFWCSRHPVWVISLTFERKCCILEYCSASVLIESVGPRSLTWEPGQTAGQQLDGSERVLAFQRRPPSVFTCWALAFCYKYYMYYYLYLSASLYSQIFQNLIWEKIFLWILVIIIRKRLWIIGYRLVVDLKWINICLTFLLPVLCY